MNIEDTQTDKILRTLLQKNIKLHFKNKVFKQGKLLLFKQNNYFIVMTMNNKKKGTINFEIPIPFNIETWKDENLVYFDYRLSALSKKKTDLLAKLKDIKCAKESKFYDSILEINILPDGEAI